MGNETNTMVDLYGLTTEASYCLCVEECNHSHAPTVYRTRVATFSSWKLAEEYVKASTLKSYKGCGDRERFRAISLLRHSDDYEIEAHEDLSVPHNPTINEI